MARKTLSAPEPITESLGATLPEVVREEAEHNKSMALQVADAEARFHDGEEYNEERLTMVANGVASRVALEFAVGGAALIRIKARFGHGNGFTTFIQTRCNFSMDTAQKMMLVAHALLLPNNQPRPLLTTVAAQGRGSIGKALALASLSREELDKLDAGEMVNGMTIGSIEVMSLKDMRDELAGRDKHIEQLSGKVAEHVAELEEADRTIRRLKRGGKEVEESSYREALDASRTVLDDVLGGSERLMASIGVALTELDQTEVPAAADGIEKRNIVMNAVNRLDQLAETLARLQQGAHTTFAAYIDDARALLITAEASE